MRIIYLRMASVFVVSMFLATASKADSVSFKNAMIIPGGSVESIDGELHRPKGAGPFPAVVLLHTCGGLSDADANWAGFFNDLGYVTLVVDTFGSRNEERCPVDFKADTAMIRDAYGALDYLGSLPYVDKARVVVSGRSMGGNAIDRLAPLEFKSPGGLNFKAGINLFGTCEVTADAVFLGEKNIVPTLVIIGDREKPERLFPCRDMGGKSPLVAVHILKDTYHAFDNDRRGINYDHAGNEMMYSASATQKAEGIIKAYLAGQLGK